VLVLIPVTLAAMMLLATAGLNWSNAGWMLLTAIAIQAGYLVDREERDFMLWRI
jgi:hypothetical protein